MKLIWHIIHKDLVRDRWALLAWAALFIAQVGLGAWLLRYDGASADLTQWLQAASAGLVFAQFLMGYILVARLVQADLLLGTDMFWVTRPITRRRLLFAKAGAALLAFGVLPVALLTPWWLWCGFGARDLLVTGLETLGWQLLMIAPAFLTASLTNDLGRVLMWTVLLFVAALMGIALLASNFQFGAGSKGIAYTRAWLTCAVMVVSCAAISAHQFLTRDLARSIGLTLVGILFVIATALFPERNWADKFAGLTDPAPAPEAVAALAGFKAEVGAGMPGDRITKSGQEPSFVTEVYFQGVPEFATMISAEGPQTWSWPDGSSIRRLSYIGSGPRQFGAYLEHTYALSRPPEDPETVAWQKAQRDKLLAGINARRAARGEGELPPGRRLFTVPPSRPGYRQLLYTNVPKALITRMSTDVPVAYAARLPAALARPVIIADLPLRAGASGGGDSTTLRLQWVGSKQVVVAPNERQAGVGASLLVTAPLVRRNGLWLAGLIGADMRNFLQADIYTINRTTGDINRAAGYSMWGSRVVIVAGVILSWNNLNVTPASVIRNGEWVFRDPQWQEHTEIVGVTEQIAGRFTLDLKTDRLEFKPSLWQERDPTAAGSDKN